MEQAKVYILDVFHRSGLAERLYKILESSSSPTIQLQGESRVFNELGLRDGRFLDHISRFKPDVVFLVFGGLTREQVNSLVTFVCESLHQPLIVVSEETGPQEIMDILRLGPLDFIVGPLRPNDVLPRLWRVLDQIRRDDPTTLSLKKKLGLEQLVGESPAFISEIQKIPIVARFDATVLISGETGTGKELCARAVHYLSLRSGCPFIAVNCGAVPSELIENELFGHIQGAFTGAHALQLGLIHEANGGTLFLDDIECLPLQAQVKLLRFLQEKEYKPLGSAKTYRAELRVVAATNIDLEKEVKGGRFRQDLFYRLNVIPLSLPPLRNRKEDIVPLAHHFLDKYSHDFNKECAGFTHAAIAALLAHDWPGNVRELENVVERALLFSLGNIIRRGDIMVPSAMECPQDVSHESFRRAKERVIEEFEKTYIEDLLRIHRGNITKAAEAAKKNRRAFWELIRKHKIDPRMSDKANLES